MSSIGHVSDMIRRNKENRELRKSFSNRSSTKDQCVLKSKKDIKDISLEEMEDIREKIDSKTIMDEIVPVKSLLIMLLCSFLAAVIIFIIMLAIISYE